MKITIAQRFAPFSHLPGTFLPIPFTNWEVQAFPVLLRFRAIGASGKVVDFPLQVTGPVNNFTAKLNIEKGQIELFGHAKSGYFLHKIAAGEKGIAIDGKLFIKTVIFAGKFTERLALGSHKQQDFDGVRARGDLSEILPIWYALAQLMPQVASPGQGGVFTLFDKCKKALADKREIARAYLNLFNASFVGILSPRLTDENHLGFQLDPLKGSDLEPLQVLSRGKAFIRQLFFKDEGDTYAMLPHLPPQFHAGRFTGFTTERGDTLNCEWSKKLLKKVVVKPGFDGAIFLRLQSPLKSFRVRKNLRERGYFHDASLPLELKKGEALLLDNFKK